ncbi:helix-hairpin-helix domain-containing protein [Pseudalkalibacillus decolorationis]|uniref:helix-hairpin-helix domain-containing protein n=1 Tax=Pseudalkalibacillus decolorationis TaxID=163879 RepID=UPI0021488891|nr:helix-hairpin-helix domain-containing protein [Pseudalkalibacillus decolorationis]
MIQIYWESLTKKERVMAVIIIVFLILTLFFGYTYFSEKSRSDIAFPESEVGNEPVMQSNKPKTNAKDTNKTQEKKVLMIDVKGAVKSPGVYQISGGKRVNDIILMAGGLTSDADSNGLNLAQLLEDEMVVYVPKIGEQAVKLGEESEEGKVNVNKAEASELETITGIGPSKAEAIIRYREENGPFQAIEDLTNVPGIGEKSIEQMKEQITISN